MGECYLLVLEGQGYVRLDGRYTKIQVHAKQFTWEHAVEAVHLNPNLHIYLGHKDVTSTAEEELWELDIKTIIDHEE